MTALSELAHHARAWPFEEARRLAERLGWSVPEKGHVLFETGYGPSGLPHIGTYCEVVRTSMVRHAFETLTGLPTRLYCFSDDMDGLRKVPDNIPNQAMVTAHLGKPLCDIPDPFEQFDSFAAQNNARLCRFLDELGFDYTFQSAASWYRSGGFDAALRRALEIYDKIMEIMLPTLGPERQATYSPFLPISPKSGRVLQVPLEAADARAGTVTFRDEEGERVTQPVTGGHCKMQWKPDWALRWYALGVDYEMSGKDLIDSVRVSSRIVRALGQAPPEGMHYEMFLDEQGAKISKSRGNGLSTEEWLRYAPQESLALFMYSKPRAAKKLYFDVIPRHVDDYLRHAQSYPAEPLEKQIENPAWHIHLGAVPAREIPVSFAMLLNLASVVHAEDKSVLWGFIARYAPGADPATMPYLDRLAGHAVRYYQDFVAPEKRYRTPDPAERAALADLAGRLAPFGPDSEAEEIMSAVYATGKDHGYGNLRDWFQALYETLLGQSQGPRMGSFIKLYGLEESRALIARVLEAAEADPSSSAGGEAGSG